MKLSEHTKIFDSIDAYKNARDFWKALFDSVKAGSVEFINNKFSNGKAILDGNPIYSAYYNNSQAVRIIQNRVSTHDPILTCWIQKSFIKEIEINELIVFLQPLEYLSKDVIRLIDLHVNNKLSKRYIYKLNRKYQQRWDLLRSKKIVKRLENISLFEEQSMGQINIHQGSLKDFVRLVSFESYYVNVASSHISSPVSIALKKVENRVLKLTNVITLKGTLSMTKQPSINSYNQKIKIVFASKLNFSRSLISKIKDLKFELNELKQEL